VEEFWRPTTGGSSWGASTENLGWSKGTDASGNAITFPGSFALFGENTNVDGTSVIDYDNFGAGFATYRGVKFPAAGYKMTASLIGLGEGGFYWSSSVESSISAYGMAFNDTRCGSSSLANHEYLSIRCVKN
jgi:hypothetical protein